MPNLYSEYHKRAKLVELFEGEDEEVSQFFLSVARGSEWPFLVVMQRYSPGPVSGFYPPGVLLIPETHLLFIGVGDRIVIYSLDSPKRLWDFLLLVEDREPLWRQRLARKEP
jgi:hypothetical protein